jgi:uncharacterized protein (TIGR02996 family)
MTSDEQAFLRAIDASPLDDVPRLVYADWLQERGQDARAEFIRIQCEIAKIEIGPRDVVDANWKLWHRQQELLDDHPDQFWAGPLQNVSRINTEFQRGFLSQVNVDVAWFCEHDDWLNTLLPKPRILVSDVAARFDDFLRSPALEIVQGINVFFSAFDEEIVAARVGDSALYPLLMEAMPRLVRLQELDLRECYIHDAGLSFFELGSLPKLRSVNLEHNELTDLGIVYLINLGLLQRLEVINLSHNPLTDQSAFELADRLGRSTRLKHLVLRNTNITSAGQSALLSRFGSRVDLF